MIEETHQECRYFVSYSGIKLPFNLVKAIPAEALSNRNTFIRAFYDNAGKLRGFEKVVYGEVELAHRYEYHDNGAGRSEMGDESVGDRDQSLPPPAQGQPCRLAYLDRGNARQSERGR
jgi:Family of unknown function (DUF6156)